MNWLSNLLIVDSVAQAVLVVCLVSAIGLALGHIQIRGIGLGAAGVLFVGITFGHYGIDIDQTILTYIHDFGLILFVYSIGMQIGPGFVASLKKDGLLLNSLALSVVLLGVLLTITITKLMQIPPPLAVGLLSGATTNTPSLAAVQQALAAIPNLALETTKLPGLGYAVAYPFGIFGIIISMLLLRSLFRIGIQQEPETISSKQPVNREQTLTGSLSSRTIVVTKTTAVGHSLFDLNLSDNVVQISRADIDIKPHSNFQLQFGDVLLVVGREDMLQQVAKTLGNFRPALNAPRMVPFFVGLASGVLLGSIPLPIPGLAVPVKLGLAGGPLLVAILLSQVGRIGPLIWYLSPGALQVLRELGIIMFLAGVGLHSGDKFVPALASGDGFLWMGYGALITLMPLLVVGIIARHFFKLDYSSLCGLLAGSMTDPPALAFANTIVKSEKPSVAYATVYPLVMVFRILSAQLLIGTLHLPITKG